MKGQCRSGFPPDRPFCFVPFGNLLTARDAGSLTPAENLACQGLNCAMQLHKMLRKTLITLTLGLFSAGSLWAGQWTALGPDGGDVRSLSHDPRNPDHILLGTSTGTIFQSTDGGRNWSRFAHLGGDEFVLDHIAFDPKNPQHIYVAAWSVENQQAGDVFHSNDGGKNWQPISGLHNKSVRAFAIAPSDSNVLVAGALDGVYRSRDEGKNWERISASPGYQEHRIHRHRS